MRLSPLAFAALLLPLASCSGTADDKADDTGAESDTDTDADTDADTDTDTDAPPLMEDVRERMQKDAVGCEDVDGTPVPGGSRYFWGEYLGDVGTGWTGTEAVYVYANEAWKDVGGEDCVAYWVVTGGFGGTGDCPTCDVGVAVTATYDGVNSTCPEDMWGESFTSGYAVDLGNDGTSTWYYTSTATLLGTGVWKSDVGMNFLTERACTWF